jgi:two-component system, NarL family, nitrate/nitrite response regulator NarL
MKHSVPSIIVERRTLLREGLASLLHDTPYKVIACLATVSELSTVSPMSVRPTLILLGLWDGVGEALKALKEVQSLPSGSKVVVVAESAGTLEIQELLRRGANGVIVNVSSRDVFIKALDLAFLDQEFIVIGHQFMPLTDRKAEKTPVIETKTSSMDDNGGPHASRGDGIMQLSERERQVLACLTRGESNKLIARNCSIAEATVKVHLKAILRKISVRNRTQAALWALAHNMPVNQNGNGQTDGAYQSILARQIQSGPELVSAASDGELGNR